MTRKELIELANIAILTWKPDVEDGYGPDSFRECALMQDAYIAGFLAGRDAAAEVIQNTYVDFIGAPAIREIKALGEDT